jgi:hypothetical protein
VSEIDPAVHDYLDGRLSENERRAFEDRLERDPELARTVEAYRAAGRALRDEPVELPPGFYARARARFEASRPARPAWRRFVSWESTGLAAAALILTALIFPEVWERYRPARDAAPSGRPSTTDKAAGREPKAVSPAEAEESTAPTGERGAAGLETPPADAPEPPRGRLEIATEEKEAFAPEPEAFAAEPEALADDDSRVAALDEVAETRRMTEPQPAPEKRRAKKDHPAGASRRDQALGESSAKQTRQATPELDAESEAYLEPRGEKSEEGGFAPAPALAKKTAPRGEALPAGMVAARELLVIDDAASWERFLQRLPAGSSLSLRPDFATERVAVVGPASEVGDCSAARLRETGDRLVIEWPPTVRREEAGAPGGCVVVVPADGRPVALGGRS